MKQVLKQVLAVGALALVSSGAVLADASVVGVSDVGSNSGTIANANSGNGGLVLSIFSANPDQNLSLSANLGLTLNQVIPTEMDQGGLTLTWDVSDLLSLATLSNYDTIVWGVNAYNNVTKTLVSTMDTVNSASTAISNLVVGTGGNLQNGINVANTNANTSPVDVDTSTGSQRDELNSGPGTGYGYDDRSWATDTSSTLAMYQYVQNANGTVAASTATAYAGTWSLNLSAQTLTYSVAAVPLPAAVWLLMSALGGLGVVGRRRQVQV